LQAKLHQRAAVARAFGAQFVRREPQRAQDAVIQAAIYLMRQNIAAKGKAQIGDVFCGCGQR